MKVLVIQTAFPGDAILTLPMIQKYKENNPEAEIDVLSIPAAADIFKSSPSVSGTIIFDKKGKDKGFLPFLKLIGKIRKLKYDKVISPHRSARSAFVSFFSGAETSITFDKSSFNFLYGETVHYNRQDHEVKRNLSLIGFNASGDNWKILPELNISSGIQKKVNEIIASSGSDKFICVAPGSVWETKKYPLSYYAEIVKKTVSEGYKVYIIGGKEDKPSGVKLRSVAPENVINLCGELSIIESVCLISKAFLLISNDSAPTHMGTAVNIPVLTIYCSTIPEFGFYPYNSKSYYLSYDKLECKPCGIHGYKKCPLDNFKCGYELKPDTVLNEIFRILRERYS